MVKSRTIDDLGIETSVRYASDQEYLDENLLRESQDVRYQTEIDVTTPSFSSEYDRLFETHKKNLSWAKFFSPGEESKKTKQFFTHQLLPSIGNEDMLIIHSQKIKDSVDRHKEKFNKERDERQKKGQTADWEEELELDQEEKESEALISLIENICKLDKILIEIHSRKNQYQKG